MACMCLTKHDVIAPTPTYALALKDVHRQQTEVSLKPKPNLNIYAQHLSPKMETVVQYSHMHQTFKLLDLKKTKKCSKMFQNQIRPDI